jgi:hypothetical protein
MNIFSLVAGALMLRTDTFHALRERSDVFYRGFLVLFLVGLLAGAFAAGTDLATRVLRPANERLVTQEALRGFENSYNGPPEIRSMIGSYITEGVAMGFELSRLPPNSGAAFRPFARLLRWLGESIAVPFGSSFLGFLLLAGLVVHLASRWLGGRAGVAQMLGLSALGFAPYVLDPIARLLSLAGNLSGSGALGPVESLIGFVVFAWGTVIYVKATAIAQHFSYGRAIGAILIALGITFLSLVLLSVMVAAIFASLIASLVAATR